MKNANFKPLQLAFDNVAAAEWDAEKQLKIEQLDKLKKYLSKFIFEVSDYNEFKESPATTTYNLVKNSYGKDFPEYIEIDALYTLIGLNLIELNSLLHSVNSISVEIDWQTYEATPPEFYTYTVNQKQNDAFNLIQYAIDSVNKTGDKLGVHIYPFEITKGFNGMVKFDFITNKLQPNTNFILDLK